MNRLPPNQRTTGVQRPRLVWLRRHAGAGASFFSFLWLSLSCVVHAQAPPQIPPSSFIQLQVAQPVADVNTPITATAAFDSPVIRPGEKTFYRVNITFTESAVQWPDKLAAPGLTLAPVARGEITQNQSDSFRPLTSFVYEAGAAATGHFTIPAFSVDVAGALVQVPAANLDVVAPDSPGAPIQPPARKLAVSLSQTNLYLGQPFRVRVMLPAGPRNQIEALREVQFSSDGLMADKMAVRQSIDSVYINGQPTTAYVCEMIVTPIAAGPMKFSAQGFSAGNEFGAPLTIRGQVSIQGGPPQYRLLVSDPVEINVRPLPVDAELPGFTGAIGRFFSDPPKLAASRIHVGEPVQLKAVFHGYGDLARMAPPATPVSRDWEIIADPPPATSFTLIPLSDEPHETPAIPFCYFDPEAGKYIDLTIPALPVTIVGEGLPAELPVVDDEGKAAAPLKLGGLAMLPGTGMGSLRPLQLQGWFAACQLLPAAGFLALWLWDRRRRYFEAHPGVLRRRRARRDLRRERRRLDRAAAAGDAAAFVRHASRAMSVAAAPHFPADPRALVGGDILSQLDQADRAGAPGRTVKQVFAAADAQYSVAPMTAANLKELGPGVAAVLDLLEARL